MFYENSTSSVEIGKNTSVRKNGESIPGRYASGGATRGVMVSVDIGVQYIEGVFSALSYAFNSGDIYGTEAATYAKNHK